ncbi:MAG: 2,3-bisphosphoglycerate-independent phosphoglycerate mutase [Pyrinomonadaceae bacterium]
MTLNNSTIRRPVALVILDGWGYAPRTEGNAIAVANTPYYDEICRNYPMTTLCASGSAVWQADETTGSSEVGHLNIGTGRPAQTDIDRIKNAVRSGEFIENEVINRAFAKAKEQNADVHLIGLLSDGGVHSSTENLFAMLRAAKRHDVQNIFIHCILDGLDVPERTADIYVEALEIKLADIGVGRIASLCGRFFAMDSSEKWERTARVFTMLVHAEGERTDDAVTAIRNSFLRGISDEFISPIVIERSPDVPMTTIKNGDLVMFFNHRPETSRQLVRSLCVPNGDNGTKPLVETVCLVEYDNRFDLPTAFRPEPEQNTLCEVLSRNGVANIKITEPNSLPHLTYYFDGGGDPDRFAQEIIVAPVPESSETFPESQSFKITDKFRKSLKAAPDGFFVVNIPAANMMAETGDFRKTVAAIQYIDTCIGGICEAVRSMGGVVMITSSHGRCEQMIHSESGEPNPLATANPVPFHYVTDMASDVRLSEGRSLADIAPTVLGILNIEKPPEMTGADVRCE